MTTASDPVPGEVCRYCGEDCAVGVGHCHCGCGARAGRAQRSGAPGPGGTYLPRGAFHKYVHGHAFRHRAASMRPVLPAPDVCVYCARAGVVCPVGAGYCHCGCGERTGVIRDTSWAKGHVKGAPLKFAVPSHAARVLRRFTPTQVRAIRAEYLAGATIRSLSARYRCAHTTIERIVLLDSYQDVT